MAGRIAVFLYGVFCYLVFFLTFLYAIGFVGNIAVPKSIDSGVQVPFAEALVVDLVLLGIFAFQHSLMARPWFKAAWTRIVPLVVERSTYVLLASAALLLLFLKWQPMGGLIWKVESGPAQITLECLCAFGWLTVLGSTLVINHFDLFGLRQVWLHLLHRPYASIAFRTPGPYRYVRHPLYVGFLFAFWSTPAMKARTWSSPSLPPHTFSLRSNSKNATLSIITKNMPSIAGGCRCCCRSDLLPLLRATAWETEGTGIRTKPCPNGQGFVCGQ